SHGPGPRLRPRSREVRGQGLRLRRGPLDGAGRERRGRARERPHRRPLRAVRLARAGPLPEQGPLRHALRLRRARGEEVKSKSRSDALSFFGATGDLAYKKIFPALQAMARRGRLDFPVVGVAKSGWTRDQLVERAKASVAEHGGGVDDE